MAVESESMLPACGHMEQPFDSICSENKICPTRIFYPLHTLSCFIGFFFLDSGVSISVSYNALFPYRQVLHPLCVLQGSMIPESWNMGYTSVSCFTS